MITVILIIIICVLSFIGGFGELIKREYADWKSKKEFEKRQERYRRMF